jgi:hypothetical protein
MLGARGPGVNLRDDSPPAAQPAATEARFALLEAEHRACLARCRRASARERELVDVAVAALRLRDVATPRDVLLAIESLFANLFATEDLVIYEVGVDMLRPLSALGAGAALGTATRGHGPVGRAVSDRAPVIARDRPLALSDEGPRAVACVPLVVGACVVAVVVALSFAERIGPAPDVELVELAARHAALAFWNASIDGAASSERTTLRCR